MRLLRFPEMVPCVWKGVDPTDGDDVGVTGADGSLLNK
jgi:hypothetical protein